MSDKGDPPYRSSGLTTYHQEVKRLATSLKRQFPAHFDGMYTLPDDTSASITEIGRLRGLLLEFTRQTVAEAVNAEEHEREALTREVVYAINFCKELLRPQGCVSEYIAGWAVFGLICC